MATAFASLKEGLFLPETGRSKPFLIEVV